VVGKIRSEVRGRVLSMVMSLVDILSCRGLCLFHGSLIVAMLLERSSHRSLKTSLGSANVSGQKMGGLQISVCFKVGCYIINFHADFLLCCWVYYPVILWRAVHSAISFLSYVVSQVLYGSAILLVI